MSGNASRIVAWNGAGREREPDVPWGQSYTRGDRGPERYRETDWRRRDRSRDDERPMRREDGPYREEYRSSGNPYYEEPNRYEEPRREEPRREEPRREEPRRERVSRPRGEREQSSQYQDEADVRRPRYEPPVFVTRDEPPPESPRIERAPPWPPENDRDEFVDQAVAEITARQRALDSAPRAKPPRRQPTLETDVRAETTVARRPVHYAAADIAAPQRTIAADFAAIKGGANSARRRDDRADYRRGNARSPVMSASNQRQRKFHPTTR